MPSFSTLTVVIVSAIAPLAVAHYHHNHNPGNWGHGGHGGHGAYHHNRASGQSPSASVAPVAASSDNSFQPVAPTTTAPPANTYGGIQSVPYPTGNTSTSGAGISTSWITRFTSTTTLTVTIPATGGESGTDENPPASATSGADSLGISAALVAEGVSSAGRAQSSMANEAGAAAASSVGGGETCPAPVTVTVTGSNTVTVTVPAPTSQPRVESQAPEQVPSSAEILPPVQSQRQSGSQPSTISKPYYPNPVSSAPIGGSGTVGPLPTASSTPSSSAPPYSARDVASSSVAASPVEASSTPWKTRDSSLTPNGVKAGIAAYPGATSKAAWTQFEPYIGWYSDYTPTTPDCGKVKGIPMVCLFLPR